MTASKDPARFVSDRAACADTTHTWVVDHREHNHSAFNGGHRTASDYSQVRCITCGRAWRSKAAYVAALPDRDGWCR